MIKLNPFKLLLHLAMTSLLGCSFAQQELGIIKSASNQSPNTAVESNSFGDKQISFEILKMTSLKNCLECHGSGHNDLHTPDALLRLKNQTLTVINNNTMPPQSSGYKTLSECEKQILETWFDDQAQNRESGKIKSLSKCADIQSPQPEQKVEIKTLAVTFENLQKYILAPKCLSCHATDIQDAEIYLDSIKGMQDSGVLAELAEDSDLFKVVLPGARRQMPPKKSGIPLLTEDERLFLKTWINNGAKD